MKAKHALPERVTGGRGVRLNALKFVYSTTSYENIAPPVHKQIYKHPFNFDDSRLLPSPPANLMMLSNLVPPRLAESRCTRLGHIDPCSHRPVPDKLSIDAG